MRFFVSILVIILSCSFLISCQREVADSEASGTNKSLFDSVPIIKALSPTVGEISGIADSKKNTGYLWAEEDGGNPTQLYLVKHDGNVSKKIFIKGITNRDWEDMTLSGNEIYLGEIGDNNAVYPEYAFYKFTEPDIAVDTITAFETIRFQYPDGSHDAEAFVVDPSTNTIYIITKRDNPSRIYKLTPPFSSATVYAAEAVGQLNYNGVVSAAISTDRKEIILKTYFGLNYYKISSGEKIETALQQAPTAIPYQMEPQGEAVCFSATNNGYFTLSEVGFASAVNLYFYKRN